MLIIAISGKRNQGKSAVAVSLASQFKRCTIISVYDVVNFFCNYQSDDERDAIVEQIRRARENYLVDSLKLRITLDSNKYDVFIIDDVFDSCLMNQLKTELNAQIVGIEKPSLHKLPISIRDNVATGLLGEPDYVVRFSFNTNELINEINCLMTAFRNKGLISAE